MAATWPWGRLRMISKSGGSVGDLSAAEQLAEAVDDVGGPLSQVGQCSLADLACLAEGFSQEEAGRGVAIGDGFDVHGHHSASLDCRC